MKKKHHVETCISEERVTTFVIHVKSSIRIRPGWQIKVVQEVVAARDITTKSTVLSLKVFVDNESHFNGRMSFDKNFLHSKMK